MELDKDRDLFLLNIGKLIGGINMTKICDENIYVDNMGNVLKDIQWFTFQLILIIMIINNIYI